MNERFASTLALCMRAKKLTFGLDTVRYAVQRSEVYLLLTASDLSAKSQKEVAFLAEKYHLPHLALTATMSDIAATIGKKTGVLAVTEQGLAKKLGTVHYETEETNL